MHSGCGIYVGYFFLLQLFMQKFSLLCCYCKGSIVLMYVYHWTVLRYDTVVTWGTVQLICTAAQWWVTCHCLAVQLLYCLNGWTDMSTAMLLQKSFVKIHISQNVALLFHRRDSKMRCYVVRNFAKCCMSWISCSGRLSQLICSELIIKVHTRRYAYLVNCEYLTLNIWQQLKQVFWLMTNFKQN